MPLAAQDTDEKVFTEVETLAEFEGGMEAFYQFIASQMKYPTLARKLGIQGKLYTQFVVEKDGSISQVTLLNGLGGDCDEEAIRVISQSPQWTPAQHDGQAVRNKLVIPLIFKLKGEDSGEDRLVVANGKVLGLFKDLGNFFQKINSQNIIDYKPLKPEEAVETYGEKAKHGALLIEWKEGD